MREIKFRGQRREDGKWVYGYVDATMYKDVVVIHSEASTHAVVPETVGQYTGLKDRNNKEIYEGDVLDIYFPEDGKPTRCTVKWTSEKARFDYIFTNKWHFLLPQDAYEVEVVGNIQDLKEFERI